MAWYDLDQIREDTSREWVKKTRYDELLSISVDKLNNMINLDLREGEQYRIITNNTYNAISFIDFLLKHEQIKQIYIAVYRLNQKSVTRIIELIERDGVEMNLLLSSFFRENKKYEEWTRQIETYARTTGRINLGFAVNHAKVFCAYTESKKYFVFEGSGNLSDNARIEQYLVENSKEMYNFHRKWISYYIKKYKDEVK